MTLQVFNNCIIAGWLLTTIGGIALNVGAGLIGSGLLLIALTGVMAHLAGIYAPKDEE